MKIYSFPTFNAGKILLSAEELGMDYEWVQIDLGEGEHKSVEHLARHPLGKVPALEYEGEFYIESNAICRFLASLNDNRLYGADAKGRARVDGWIDMMALHTGRWLTTVLFEEIVKGKLMGAEPSGDIISEAKGFLEAQFPVIENALSNNAFLAGSSLTIADIIAFNYFYTAEFSSVDLSAYPAITAWYDNIRGRPSFDRMIAQSPTGCMLPFAA